MMEVIHYELMGRGVPSVWHGSDEIHILDRNVTIFLDGTSLRYYVGGIRAATIDLNDPADAVSVLEGLIRID